jgi:hypothetical protein
VDINDLTIVLADYGQSLGSSTPGMAPVPEPSSVVLLGIGAIAVPAYARPRLRRLRTPRWCRPRKARL